MRQTIKSKQEINRLFTSGQRVQTTNVLALVDAAAGVSCGRIAVIAGKRLGSAPKRNHAKRLIREAARQNGAPWAGRDVVLVARDSVQPGSFAAVASDVQRIAARLEQTGRSGCENQKDTIETGPAQKGEGSATLNSHLTQHNARCVSFDGSNDRFTAHDTERA